MKPGPKPVPKDVLARRGSWRARAEPPAPRLVGVPVSVQAPPGHLSAAMKRWWKSVIEDWEFGAAEYVLLRHACEAYDLAEQARKTLRAEGLTVTDTKGQRKAHPAVAIARDARAAFARLVKQLGIETYA